MGSFPELELLDLGRARVPADVRTMNVLFLSDVRVGGKRKQRSWEQDGALSLSLSPSLSLSVSLAPSLSLSLSLSLTHSLTPSLTPPSVKL